MVSLASQAKGSFNVSINKKNFIFPLLINIFDIKLPEGSDNLVQYSFGVLILSLAVLVCFINIFGYFLSLYLIQRYNILEKYPRLKLILNYF